MYKAYWWFNIQEGRCSFAHKNFSFETVIGWVAWIPLTSHHTLWNNAANIQLIKGTVFPWVKCQAGLNIYNKQAPWGICSCLIRFVVECSLCTLFLFFFSAACASSWLHGFVWLQKHKVTRQTFYTFSWMVFIYSTVFLIQNNPSLLLNLMVCVVSLLSTGVTELGIRFTVILLYCSQVQNLNSHGRRVTEEIPC